jgi:O-antigen/teichoic acid export membrane protein
LNTTSDPSGSRVVSNTLSLGAVSVLTMFLGLAGTMIITRHFPPEDFGVYTLVLVFVSFLSQISTLGLELSIPKFIASAKDDLSKEQLFSTAVWVRVAAIVFTCLLAWYGSPWLKLLFGRTLLPGFILYVPLLFTVESLRALLRATLQGSLLFSKIAITDSITSCMYLALVIVIYIINGEITLLILARAFSTLLACLYAFFSIPIKKRLSFQMGTFKQLIKFGYPLQINDIMSFIYSRIDTLSVAMFLGPTEIATYEVARKIPDYLRVFYEPFRSVYYPFISKRYALAGSKPAAHFLNDALRFVTFITLLGTAIATLFGQEILQLVFTQKYSSGAPIFAILMFNLSLGLMGNVMGTTLVAVGDTKKPAIVNFFNTIASWLGSILLIPLFSLLGASVANTTGTLIAVPLNRYFLRKKIELKDTAFLKPLGIFGVWSLLVYIIKPELFLIKAAFLAGFVLACVFLSVITKRDLLILLDGLPLNSWQPLKKFIRWIS